MASKRGVESLRELRLLKLNKSERRLRDFVLAMYDERPVPRDTLEFLATAFWRVFAGEDVVAALGLDKSRGRRPLLPSEYEPYAIEVWGRRYLLDESYEKAVLFVAQRHQLSVNTVKTYYRLALANKRFSRKIPNKRRTLQGGNPD